MVYKPFKRRFFSNPGQRKLTWVFFVHCLIFFSGFIAILLFQTEFNSRSNHHGKMMIEGDLLSHMVFGFTDVSADFLWLRVIQDIDYKETEHVQGGWVYQVLDAITTLDQRYQMVYRQGLTVLSIIIRDKAGAAKLYERGVKVFPGNWEIAYRAGYHFLHEVKDCKRAAYFFKIAADDGAPAWLHALSSRLYAKAGQYEIARTILLDALERSEDEKYHEKFRERLDQLEKAYRDPKNKTLIGGLECENPAKI
jgi:tetratricopeptide (TPR) repeat protein